MLGTHRRISILLLVAAVTAAPLPAQILGFGEPTGTPPPASGPATVRPPAAEPFVVTLPQGSGASFVELIPQIEAKAKAAGQPITKGTFLLVADVSHQMVQITEGGTHAPTWKAEGEALLNQSVQHDRAAHEKLQLHNEMVRSWEGRFVSYEHHGPIASMEAKAQNMPNAASMILRDWDVLTRTLRERYVAGQAPGKPVQNIGIVIHDFSDADAISSKMLMEELAKRITGEVPIERPIDPMLEHMAKVRARQADQGNLGREGARIERTLEGALEGVNYEIEAEMSRRRDLPKEQVEAMKSKYQVEAATEFMETFMEKARQRLVDQGIPREKIGTIPVEARIPDEAIPELVEATKRELATRAPRAGRSDLRRFHERGAERARRYGEEVAEAMRRASSRPGEVVQLPQNEFVKSASVQDVWIETSEGGMKRTRMLTVEITQPPISKAAFWTAYNSTGGGAHPPAELVLIKGEGFVNWFAGSKRGLSVKGITAPLADAKPQTVEGRKGPVFEPTGTSKPWKQNFPAFKGAAYDWAISLGSIDFAQSGGSIHDLARDFASEGQRLAEQGGHTGSRVRAGSGLNDPVSRSPRVIETTVITEVAQKVLEKATQERDPRRSRELFETAREMSRHPERFTIEQVLEMPGIKELPPAERVELRRVHEERTRFLREQAKPEVRASSRRRRLPRIIP